METIQSRVTNYNPENKTIEIESITFSDGKTIKFIGSGKMKIGTIVEVSMGKSGIIPVAKRATEFTIECESSGGFMSTRASRYYYQTGTFEELLNSYRYTLECGKSYENEKGNKKINCNPKSIESLVSNLNRATNNSAANGYSGKSYRITLHQEKKN